MDLFLHLTFLPADDPEASLVFYRDVLGFEVRNDVGHGAMRWVTVGSPAHPQTSVVLHPPVTDPGVTDDERRVVAELMAKGSYGAVVLGTSDVDAVFAQVQAAGAEVVQEPADQPYGVRDCAFRDPAGNMVRIHQVA